MALIAQLVDHCTGNAKVVGSNLFKKFKDWKCFQLISPVVLWMHSHLSLSHVYENRKFDTNKMRHFPLENSTE